MYSRWRHHALRTSCRVVCEISANPQTLIDLRVSLTEEEELADYTTEVAHPTGIFPCRGIKLEPSHQTMWATNLVEWWSPPRSLASMMIEGVEASKLNQRQR